MSGKFFEVVTLVLEGPSFPIGQTDSYAYTVGVSHIHVHTTDEIIKY